MLKKEKRANFHTQFDWPIIGHKNILWYLQNSILSGNLNHAYLLVGPKSIGKFTVAQCFIASLFCKFTHQSTGEVSASSPCRRCLSCQQFFKQLHPDIYPVRVEISAKSGLERKNISIAQIRDLQSKLAKRSFLNSYKVAIIDDAELMTIEAANSLLKTLEEPSAQTIIILISSDLSRIPSTIASRCQVLKFLPVAQEEIVSQLTKQGVERALALILANLSLGRPGLAIDLLKQDLLENYQQEVYDFIKIKTLNLTARLAILSEFYPRGGFISQLKALNHKLDIWLSVTRDLILLKSSTGQFIKNSFAKKELEKLLTIFSLEKLIDLNQSLEEAKKYLTLNINPRLLLENLLINL